jgi:hypothetical protein
MEEQFLASISQKNCSHRKHKKYTERDFDILNGFEIEAVRCANCYKILELTIKAIGLNRPLSSSK